MITFIDGGKTITVKHTYGNMGQVLVSEIVSEDEIQKIILEKIGDAKYRYLGKSVMQRCYVCKTPTDSMYCGPCGEWEGYESELGRDLGEQD